MRLDCDGASDHLVSAPGDKVMNLQIHDPRAKELAEKLARLRDVSVDDAVIEALEKRLEETASPGAAVDAALPERLRQIARNLRSKSKGVGRDMTKDEIDAMWGHD
jgi:antitoxin VapB